MEDISNLIAVFPKIKLDSRHRIIPESIGYEMSMARASWLHNHGLSATFIMEEFEMYLNTTGEEVLWSAKPDDSKVEPVTCLGYISNVYDSSLAFRMSLNYIVGNFFNFATHYTATSVSGSEAVLIADMPESFLVWIRRLHSDFAKLGA